MKVASKACSEVVGDALAFPVAITGRLDLTRAAIFLFALGFQLCLAGLLGFTPGGGFGQGTFSFGRKGFAHDISFIRSRHASHMR